MKLIKEINEEIHFLVENTDAGKSYVIEGIFLQGNLKNRNGRLYPTDVLKREVERYNREYVSCGRALGELSHPECYLSDNIDILTISGWKQFKDIKLGDSILSLSPTGKIEEDVIQKIINEPYKGHGYHIKSKNIDSKLTPNHRMILKDRHGNRTEATIEEIYNNRKKYNKHTIVKNGIWEGNSPENIRIPGITSKNLNKFNLDISKDLSVDTKVFVQFLGIWLAEGRISNTKHYVRITQNIGEKSDQIEEMLSKFPKELKWKKYTKNNRNIFDISDIRLHTYLKVLGNKYNKYIPHEIKQLDSVLLEELIQWFVLGDGRTKNNLQNLFSVSKQLIEDLHECLIKSGGSGNWTIINPKNDYEFAGRIIKANNKKPLYQLNLSTCPGIYLDDRFLKIEKIEHDGNVYCIRVKNGNFYVKENNKAYWTGNSPSINLERVSHIIKELHQDGDNFYGRAKIMDTPYGKIVKSLIDEGAKLGVSSRGLGTLQEKNGVNYVGEDFRLVTAADIVSDPSAPEAFVRSVKEDKEWIYENGIIMEKDIERIKKEISKTSSRNLESKMLEEFKRFLGKI